MRCATVLVVLALLLAAPAASLGAEPAPAFTLSGLDGGSVTLASLKGKVVVLNFFRTFCPHCVKEVPELNDLYLRLGPRGVAVLGMGLEAADSLRRYVASHGVRYPVLVCSEEVRRAYSDVPGTGGLRGVPTTVIVSPSGQVAKVFVGRPENGLIERAVKRLLPTS